MAELAQETPNISKKKALLIELRAPFLTGSIMPVLLGTAIAWQLSGVFLVDVFLLTLIAGVCLHIGANASNDYFDHTEDNTGSDDINKEFVSPFTGGSRMIQLGLLTPREVFAEAMLAFAIAGVIGIYLAFTRGMLILILGIIGAGSGFFYTAPPFRFVHRGIGEVFIALNFGVLMVLGSFYVQAQDILLEPVIASVPTAILIAAVLYINEFQDCVADRDSGKRTIVVRLGRKTAAQGYAGMIALTFLWIVTFALLEVIAIESLIALTALPLGYLGVRTALAKYDSPYELVPANVATIMMHLLITFAITIAYILKSIPQYYFAIIPAAILLFVWSMIQYRKLTTPPQAG